MLSDDEVKLLNFVTRIPQSVNPYVSVAQYLKKAVEPPRLAKWAVIALYFIIIGYALIFLQALNLLWYRVRLNSLKVVTMTHLGVLFVNMPSFSVLVYFFYAPLVIVDLSLQLAVERGAQGMEHKISLLCYKFIIIYGASWVYLWVCACQLMATTWNESWSQPRQRVPKRGLPRWLRYTSHTLFFMAIFWPIPLFVCCGTKIEREYRALKRVAGDVLKTFVEPASKYEPSSFRSGDLLVLLLPAKQLVTHKDNMVDALKILLTSAAVGMSALCVIYVPFLIVSMRSIRRRQEQCTFAEATDTGQRSRKFSVIQKRLQVEYRTLRMHACMIYVTNLAFLPPIIAQLIINRNEVLRGQAWHTIVQLGMHGPMAICGNSVLAILRSQSIRWSIVLNSEESIPSTSEREIDFEIVDRSNCSKSSLV